MVIPAPEGERSPCKARILTEGTYTKIGYPCELLDRLSCVSSQVQKVAPAYHQFVLSHNCLKDLLLNLLCFNLWFQLTESDLRVDAFPLNMCSLI